MYLYGLFLHLNYTKRSMLHIEAMKTYKTLQLTTTQLFASIQKH